MDLTDGSRVEQSSQFILGKGDFAFEDTRVDSSRKRSNLRNGLPSFDNDSAMSEENEHLEQQNSYKSGIKQQQQHSSNQLNNYYEFIVHKLVQFDVRKYPDEIITKSIVIHADKKAMKAPASMNWLWYTISGSFLVIGLLALIILSVILKRRASNGFWSRENDLTSGKAKKKSTTSRLCCASNANEEDLVDATKSNINLELKQCNLRNDRFHSAIQSDEYSTNSLYGTIDRLIVKKSQIVATASGASSSTSSQSGIICANNFHSITKDPRLRNSPASYMINNTNEDTFEKTEIHF